MNQKKPEKSVMKTSLADLLTEKNIRKLQMAPDNDRLIQLEQENHRLKQQVMELQTVIESLHRQADRKNAEPVMDTEILFQQAVSALKSGNPIDAMGLLQVVLILTPGHIPAMLNLAVVYADMNLVMRAIETLNAVLDLDPENIIARRNMKILLEQERS